MRARTQRIAAAIALAVVSTIGLMPALAPVPAVAAAPSLRLVGATMYDVLPDEGRVAVTVRLTATNHLKDTVTKRFFFRVGYVTVLPGTSNFKITGESAKATVSVSTATATYTNLKIDFGANLAAGKSTTLTLTYDIEDPGGVPDRPVRISPSLVSFVAWAVATPETPGATVDVRFPEGYAVTVRRGPLDGPVPDGSGHDQWSSGTLAAPLEFVADIVADRPAEFAETIVTVPLKDGTATVLLRAWPDDPAWRDRVGALVRRALPILERELGVPWPVAAPLTVREVLPRSTGGYAGVYDPTQGSIEIGYAASDRLVIHELAHAWLNGDLVAERWAAEGFAAYYAELVGDELGVLPGAPVPPDGDPDAEIPLNAWGPDGSQDADAEAWAHRASLEFATLIAERAGPDALRAVWASAAGGIGAYQPDATATEPAIATPDWRGFLDLLESETGTDFTDLWQEWVARPSDLAAIADRVATRGDYFRSVALAGEWQLPPATRLAMRAWRFDVARDMLSAADAVLVQRDRLEAAAAAAGVTLPGTLRSTFEGDFGLAAAAAEADREEAVVDAIARAQAARPTDTGFLERVIVTAGLLGTDPDVRLREASDALATGDLELGYETATDAEETWSSAPMVGRSRIVSAALLLSAFLLFAGIVRQRRRAGGPAPA